MWSWANVGFYERSRLAVIQLWTQLHKQWLLSHTGSSFSDDSRTWYLAYKLSLVGSSPWSGPAWPPVPAASKAGEPRGAVAIYSAAVIARPARLTGGSTKHWDLPVLQMGKCTSRDALNPRDTIVFHWKYQGLYRTGLKGAATDRQGGICWLWLTLRLCRKLNPITHQF